MKQPISMIRGTTQTIEIKVYGPDGLPYIISGDEVLRFGVKRNPEDNEYLIEKELTAANLDGDVYVTILVPNDTKGLEFGNYYYDVGLQVGENYYNVIECSDFEIGYNITEVSHNA